MECVCVCVRIVHIAFCMYKYIYCIHIALAGKLVSEHVLAFVDFTLWIISIHAISSFRLTPLSFSLVFFSFVRSVEVLQSLFRSFCRFAKHIHSFSCTMSEWLECYLLMLAPDGEYACVCELNTRDWQVDERQVISHFSRLPFIPCIIVAYTTSHSLIYFMHLAIHNLSERKNI